jgi:hypothetical protein
MGVEIANDRKLDPVKVQRWHAFASGCLAFSRLCREVFDISDPNPGEQGYTFDITEPGRRVIGDFDGFEPLVSGVHVELGNPALLGYVGISETPPVPGEEDWYEGESIYVRAMTPAVVTNNLAQHYREMVGEPFPKNDFLSLAPRLKGEVWA